MTAQVPFSELADRMQRFRARMDAEQPTWELAAFFGRVNQYYFTGTMQDGLLLVPRDREPVFWVRRNFERACDDSLFGDIRPMKGFRGAAQAMGGAAAWTAVHLESELVPLALPAVPETLPLRRGGVVGPTGRLGAGRQESL